MERWERREYQAAHDEDISSSVALEVGVSKIRSLYIKASVLALFLLGLNAKGGAQDLAITGATVYSAPDAAARRDVTVLIRHGVISAISPAWRTVGLWYGHRVSHRL